MFSSRGTVRYEERGQGYRDVEKVGKHWSRLRITGAILHHPPYAFMACTRTAAPVMTTTSTT